MRILLIEDDLNFCETLRFQLEQEAYEVDVCHKKVSATLSTPLTPHS